MADAGAAERKRRQRLLAKGRVPSTERSLSRPTPNPAWRLAAACRNMPFTVFFPERGEAVDPAKAVCRQCPVRDECLTEALANPWTSQGIRGGLSERQRKSRRQAAARVAAARLAR